MFYPQDMNLGYVSGSHKLFALESIHGIYESY
jgi:hypothetical protein